MVDSRKKSKPNLSNRHGRYRQTWNREREKVSKKDQKKIKKFKHRKLHKKHDAWLKALNDSIALLSYEMAAIKQELNDSRSDGEAGVGQDSEENGWKLRGLQRLANSRFG